ncbi:MAG: efflux RND transporter periplasmic adaptor subunit, partial [Planctomycetota bacterium]
MKLALLSGALLILALPFAFVSCGGGEDEAVTEETTYRVVRGDLKITLTESGSLEARQKTNVRPRIRRGEKIISLVEEGTVVRKGDVLAELDKSTIEKDIEKFEDQIIEFETQLKNARTELEIQKQTNESELDKATLTLEVARKALERYTKGEHPQEVIDLDFKIFQAKARLEQAEYRYRSIPDLLEKKFVTEVEAKEKELALAEARGNHDAAVLAKELYVKYTQPMEEAQKKADVTEGERELSRVQARAEARLDSKTAIVRQKERQFAVAKGKLDEAKEHLGFLTVLAPQDGIVIYGGNADRWGNVSNTVKVGETAYPGRTLIELPDMTQMDVHLQIHQADVTKVKKGQRAVVTIPGRRSAVFEATVADIGSVAQSRSWRDPIKRFKVVLQITERVQGLRSGVTVETEIDVGAIENVLYIPLQAATMSGGSYFVFAKTSAGVEKRPVQLGRANEQYVEVKEGLADGDEILLVTPQMVEGEAKNGNGNGNGNGKAGTNGGPNGKKP